MRQSSRSTTAHQRSVHHRTFSAGVPAAETHATRRPAGRGGQRSRTTPPVRPGRSYAKAPSKPAGIPLVPRTAGTVDLAIGERSQGPILLRHDGERLEPRTAYRWVRSVGVQAGLDRVHPHMLRAAFIMAALDAGLPLRDVQIAARHADPRTTTVYDRRRQNDDRHAAYAVVAYVTNG
jgi:integrase